MTYTVDVTGPGLPLRIPIATIYTSSALLVSHLDIHTCDTRKRVLDIRINSRPLPEIQLIPIGMTISTPSVTRLGPAGDGQITTTGVLQDNGSRDGRLVDALVGRACRARGTRAAAARDGRDASSQ